MRSRQFPQVPVPGHRFSTLALAAALPWLAGPALAAPPPGGEVAKTHCARCHDPAAKAAPGAAPAPKTGDKAAWAPRLNRGVDALVLTAIRGHGGMPPRGGKADLTDAELRSAVLYLFDPAGQMKELRKAAPAALAPGAGPKRVSAGGLDIYLGRISAERMRAYPAGSPEARMHGGVPSGSGYHHFNVSVYDSATQAPVTGATVGLDVEKVGMGREPKALESVTIAGNTSYGAYVRLVPKSAYTFYVKVQKPGAPGAVEARFQERID